jgi:NAD(P)H-dependent FMN reductase
MALPAVAKNVLDLLDIRVMNGKLNGIVGASNLDGIPAAVQIANILRFIGGRVPMGDLYIGDLRNAWPRDEEVPPAAIVDKVNAWAGRFVECVRQLS